MLSLKKKEYASMIKLVKRKSMTMKGGDPGVTSYGKHRMRRQFVGGGWAGVADRSGACCYVDKDGSRTLNVNGEEVLIILNINNIIIT